MPQVQPEQSEQPVQREPLAPQAQQEQSGLLGLQVLPASLVLQAPPVLRVQPEQSEQPGRLAPLVLQAHP